MDIKIDGIHERAMLRLMEQNGQKTSVGMVRLLIRDAAMQAGAWHENGAKVMVAVTQDESIPEPA